MSEYRETIYRSRDNQIVFALEQGDQVIDASGITRAQLSFKQEGAEIYLLDSQSAAALFDFTQKETVRGIKVGVLVFKFGAITEGNLPDGLYDVDLYLYDAANDGGLHWSTVEMVVKDGDA